MAKKNAPLTFRDIVLGAEAETIRQALEARMKIDQLIEERDRAYERIAALETQVEEVMGEAGVYPFPPPPLPIAGFDPKAETVTRGAGPGRKPGAKGGADDASEASAAIPVAAPASAATPAVSAATPAGAKAMVAAAAAKPATSTAPKA